MAFIFQYGSNMSLKRLNGPDRLDGAAESIGVASTEEPFDLAFTVWSIRNECAAADLVPNSSGRSIYGVVYRIPDDLLSRASAKTLTRKSLDAIEGEGKNYSRTLIKLRDSSGSQFDAITYVAKNRQSGLKTSLAYVRHILAGLHEHNFPAEYHEYVRSRIVENNPELADSLSTVKPGP